MHATITVPERLANACGGMLESRTWLEQLPNALRELQGRWALSLGAPFDSDDVSCSWVAPVVCADGAHAVLKLGMPHVEAAHEIEGLRVWHGAPTVRLMEADLELNAMLLERCLPGTALRELSEREQDVIVAGLLRRLWRKPASPHPFRPLSAMIAHWAGATIAAAHLWPDAGLVREGLRLLEELSVPSPDDVLLATDLHAGNVLRAQRAPWLVIDPKPYVGDPAYDATQHLLNCRGRMHTAPVATIKRFADLLGVDNERVRLWLFARSAAEPRDIWNVDSVTLARLLA